MRNLRRIRYFGSTQQKQYVAVKEILAVVMALAFIVDVVVVDADIAESGEDLTPLITLHLRIVILKLKLANIIKMSSGSFLHTRNINFRTSRSQQGVKMYIILLMSSY